MHLCMTLSWFLFFFLAPSLALNLDGTLLLSFKYSVLSDPLSVLHNWDYNDATPCSWTGVTCAEVVDPFGQPDLFRVTTLSLPNANLLGVVPPGLGFIPHLQTLDLSSNFLNGTLPDSLFHALELRVLSLSNNAISGVIPEISSKSLSLLNLSDNALTGRVPKGITSLQSLGTVSLRSNYLSGPVPSGVEWIQVLDLSSNLLNESLPAEFGGGNLRYLNLSSNNLSGLLSPQFAMKIPRNATVDLSFNDLSGQIPIVLSDQKEKYYEGNSRLCGKPLKTLCSIPSTMSTPPNVSSANTSSPAIAGIPQTISSPETTTTPGAAQVQSQHGMKLGVIAGIAVAPLAGLGLLAGILMFIYRRRKRATAKTEQGMSSVTNNVHSFQDNSEVSLGMKQTINLPIWCCLNTTNGDETSEATGSDSDESTHQVVINSQPVNQNQKRQLTMVDGETEMDLETLLKASAYILGTSGTTIVYKAVLQDGIAYAVRRIGESRVDKLREFESNVKAIAKLQHPNIVRIRGFYWGEDEKLVVYDYISNGSLANAGYRKMGSSPNHLPFATRLKIAKGIARGLNFIHEKKHAHGNIKPSNILLTADMEPLISDLGLHRLIDSSATAGLVRCTSPYYAPESLDHGRSQKPDPKWDVYSFGILLLELLTGRVFADWELSRWNSSEEASRAVRMSDMAGREEAVGASTELGFRCASLVPQKRPSMKDAVTELEKIPS